MINWIDIIVIITILIAITYMGHILTGSKIKNVEGFFKGGNNMPWWAVSASIIATKISALTFIALPAKVFVDQGNIKYALLLGGFIIGNILMSAIFVGPYYREKVYSPYDFMGKRIHVNVAVLAKVLFLISTLLSQGVRILATAVVLQVISGMPIFWCIILITFFSVIWSWMGGIQTVIWTDLFLFLVFIFGGIIALLYAIWGVELTLPEMITALDDKAKLVIWDISMDPRKTYTLWAGLIGGAVFELASNSIDQVITQRIMCCKNEQKAKLAVNVSAISVLASVLMLFVGLSISLFFDQNPLPENFSYMKEAGQDGIFPYFVANNIPTGLSGLIIAGIFAAGISTLDSALTALSQTTVTGLRKSLGEIAIIDEQKMLKRSKIFVGIWGLIIAFFAIILQIVATENKSGLMDLGLQVPGFFYGSLLGLALLALAHKKVSWKSSVLGAVVGVAATLILWQIGIGFFWWYPIAAFITFAIGYYGTFVEKHKIFQ